jgi:hypothetical protein
MAHSNRQFWLVLAPLVAAAASCGGNKSMAPTTNDPGPGVQATVASMNVYTGNCVANLASCAGEIKPTSGVVYVVPPGVVNTIKWCINHPGLSNRSLILAGADPDLQQFPEGTTPSPVCVAKVNLSPICWQGGLRVVEHDNSSGNVPVQFSTGNLIFANTPNPNCPF